MRAVVCRTHGSADLLTVEDLPVPQPGPHDVLVKVDVAAVNFPDILIVANRYQVSVATPFTPGSELAGIVVEVGNQVSNLGVGQRVFATMMHGAFAEYASVDSAAVRPVPEGVELASAAAFWVTYVTAYHALRSVAEIVKGDRVVVLGAAGGVGLATIELATILGGRVIAAASSEAKLDVCRQRGATATINYTQEDVRDALRIIAPDGVDVVIDPVGGGFAERALRGMRWGSRFVAVGFASGEIPRIPLNLVLLKGVTVKGLDIRTFSLHAPGLVRRNEDELLALFAAGRLTPHISATYPLKETAAAMQFVADRRSTGKVLINP